MKWLSLVYCVVCVLVLSASTTPDVGFNGGHFDVGFDADLVTGGGVTFIDVNLDSLGQDIIASPLWTPVLDFSGATKWYFDPTALAGGDGSIDAPFQDLETDIAQIAEYNSSYVKQNSGVVEPGDVAVLMAGNHGDIALTQHYFSDWVGFVGAQGVPATIDSWYSIEGGMYYFDNVQGTKRGRQEWPAPGTVPDDAPKQFWIRGNTSTGTPRASKVVFNNCEFGPVSKAQAAAWPDSATYNLNAVHGIWLQYSNNIHIQNSRFYGCAGGVRGVAYGNVLNVIGNEMQYLTRSGSAPGAVDSVYYYDNKMEDLLRCDPLGHGNGITIAAAGRSLFSIVDRNYIASSTISTRDFGYADAGGGVGFGIVYYDAPDATTHTNATVTNNVVIHNGWDGILLEDSENAVVSNNTVVSLIDNTLELPGMPENSRPGVKFDGANTVNATAANNIAGAVVRSGAVPAAEYTELNSSEYTLDFSTAGLTAWVSGGPTTAFDMSLAAGSENIDAGIQSFAPNVDFLNACRPVTKDWDIGAYEYDGGTGCFTAQSLMIDSHNVQNSSSCWVVNPAEYSTTGGQLGLFPDNDSILLEMVAGQYKRINPAAQIVVTGTDLTYSVYWKNDDLNSSHRMQIDAYDQTATTSHTVTVNFDASDVLTYVTANQIDGYGIDDFGGGWYRLWITLDLTTRSISGHSFWIRQKLSETSPVSGEGLFIGGVQLEVDVATPGPYLKKDCP